MSSGGGGLQRTLDRSEAATRAKALAKLRSELPGDEGVDEQTKKELLQALEGDVNRPQLEEINKTLEKAREGLEPKFFARKQRERARLLAAERPGRRQTVLTR